MEDEGPEGEVALEEGGSSNGRKSVAVKRVSLPSVNNRKKSVHREVLSFYTNWQCPAWREGDQ